MHKNVIVALTLLFTVVFSTNVSCAHSPNTKSISETEQDGHGAATGGPTEADFSLSFSKTEVKVGDVIEIILAGTIVDGQWVYGVIQDCTMGGPSKPYIDDLELTDIELVGELTHGKEAHKMVYDDIFECNYSEFFERAEFRQKVKITGKNPHIVGFLGYQSCTENLCIQYKFRFNQGGIKVSDDKTTDPKSTTTGASDDGKSEKQDQSGEDSGDQDDPEESSSQIDSTQADTSGSANDNKSETGVDKNDKGNGKAYGAATEGDVKEMSLWALFLLGVGGGLFALLTPCVYPMIPMTVAFFTKETDKAKGKKKALVYGASILGIYMVAGVGLAAIFGQSFAYTLSTHWFPNLLFFSVFVFFALAFFGMFELTLPSGFVNKMDSKGGQGGYLGVFFIALTLVLVSFSCTAPIVGSIGLLSSDGEIMKAVAAMGGFAITFALPFTLFAFFPSWLNTLPQSGGWLNVVKVVLGFVELALAFKFLSQADLAYHWNILDRHVFLSIWIVLSIMLGIYLLGKIKFPHDSDVDRLPVPRFLFATAAFVFAAYMVPGLWGAPLKPLSGFIPPMYTQDFVLGGDNSPNGQAGVVQHKPENKDIRFSEFLHSPIKGFTAYFDYDQAIEAAEKENKMIFVDFTGHTCANCRKMEADVLTDERIQKVIADNMIILSLYCDERRKYPRKEWKKDAEGHKLKSIGDINMYRQETQFGSSGQPHYYMINAKGERLGGVWGGYENNKDAYLEFLQEGVKQFNNKG